MAQNDRQNGSDIPISKKNSPNQSSGRQPNPYRYEDLMRRENGQAPRQQTRPQSRNPQSSNGDVYINKNAQPQNRQPRPQYRDYAEAQQRANDVPMSRNQPVQEYSRGGGKPPKGKKKRGGFFKFFISLILIVALIFGGGTAYVYSIFTSTDYIKTESTSNSDLELKSDINVKNILLIGVDDRKGGSTSRSDTMILVSIDKNHKQIKMTSFMRDTYVEIPGHGKNKMNAACTYGGPQLVVDTIEYNFGIDIDNYMLVDFNAFKDVIDGLGGVTVEVEKREAEYINRTSKQKIEYGEAVKLNGEEALVYVRIRYLDSDFYRTQRQRKVISAILNQVKKTNPFELVDTAKNVLGYVETDMSPLQLTFFAEGAVLSYMRYDIVQSRVPFDNKYSSRTINGASVLSIDVEETAELVKKFIYEKAVIEEETTK